MRYRAASALCFALGALAGCASDEYTYVPEQNIAIVASPENAKEISYPIWKGPKEGSVQVSFVGLKDLELKKGDPKIRAAQIRLSVKNETAHDWTIDTSRC